MLVPPRTKAGWRVYGQAEIERLCAILSLKQLGLPLARIAELLRAGETDLDALLAVQEAMLLENRLETDHALTLVRVARARLQAQERPVTGDLVELVRRISASVLRWTPELDRLAKRHYTPEQLARVRSRDMTSELSEGWERIQSDLDKLGDPLSDEALAVGRRMVALFRQSAGGDRGLWNSSARFWREAVGDPAVADQLRMNTARYDFVGRILAELQRRGELQF
jgi:DNA-binding transcriptional MerR regulator